MCAELIDALDSGIPAGRIRMSPLANRARALLAQPVPEGPTDEELRELIPQALRDSLHGASRAMFQNTLSSASDIYKALISQELRFARAALAKWGHPTPQPVPVSERLDWRRPNALPIPITT